jgi:hypothetical protein
MVEQESRELDGIEADAQSGHALEVQLLIGVGDGVRVRGHKAERVAIQCAQRRIGSHACGRQVLEQFARRFARLTSTVLPMLTS